MVKSRSHRWFSRLAGGFVALAAILVLLALLPSLTRRPIVRLFAKPRPAEAPQQIDLGPVKPDSLYALTFSVKDPAQVQGSDSILVRVADAQGIVAEKWLHTADLDFYLSLRPRSPGHVTATLTAPPVTHLPQITSALRPIPTGSVGATRRVAAGRGNASPAGTSNQPALIAAQPNSTWQTAQSFEFGQTIFGSGDERPYAPAPAEDAYAAMLRGFQWFKFTFQQAAPRLAYFVLDVTDRDVPYDVDIYQLGKDKEGRPDVVPSTEGQFVYQPEATQNYPGLYKFRTRILKPGETYYLRIAADHPAYQLHTYDYPVPPYKNPRQAVRTGMDFLVNMGDSWHSNTPRRGAVALRTSMPHAETQLCIACHPTQFTTRGYLTAVENGYPPMQRPSIEFLTDRLYNNPRPLYGEPGTNWVRVIYSARTVSSRIPLILHQLEANVTHDPPRLQFNEGYGNYLKVHYKEREKLPGDESDGCAPDISPFEISTQSWKTFTLLYEQTKDKQWLAERDRVEKLALPYKPLNIIDVNWKITFLATLGKERYKRELDALIDQLYSYQRPNGQWPFHFDKEEKASDFITFHALYALATAGRRPETDGHVARTLGYCLAAQRPEGDWQGDPVYKGFNTPFRDTQLAVMALSTLYPGAAKSKNWDAGFPSPATRLATNDVPRLLYQLDQFWDLAPDSVRRQVRAVLATSDQPLAREAAARALGHMADPGALEVLTAALGDPSKMVQRTAAWALRRVVSRRGATVAARGRALLTSALSSPDARQRWGATRLFNQHFKYLTDDSKLLSALAGAINDPVPTVRYQAAAGLWRWYYWQVDKREARVTTLESIAARLNTETDPMVRRGLHESIYDLLDENTGYLTAWVKAAATQEDKDRISEGYEAVARDQAQVLARVLRTATPSGREGILNALWDFHTRHMALPPLKADTVAISLPRVRANYVPGMPDLHRPGYEYPPYRETVDFKYDIHNGFYQTRIGNDSDLIHFFRSSGPELEDALLACLKGADSEAKINTLKAGSALSGAGDERFTLAALRLALDPDEKVRQTVRYVYENGQRGILNLNSRSAPDPELVGTMVTILDRGNPESQAVLLPLLAGLPNGSEWSKQPELARAVRALVERQPRPASYAQALAAASSFEALMSDPQLRGEVLRAFDDPDPAVQRAAIQAALEHFLSNPETASLVETAFAKLGSSQRNILIGEVNDPKFMRRHLGTAGGAVGQDVHYLFYDQPAFKGYKEPDFLANAAVLKAIVASLDDRDANVRGAALDLLRKVNDVEKRPDFQVAVRRLQNDANPRILMIATNVLQGKKLSDALKEVPPKKVVDYDFFVGKVEPILAKPGPDGKACVECHASHAIFRLRPPSEAGNFLENDSRENFRYALRVIDIANPQHSLILIKPTRPTDSAGNVADYYATHNGGQRWQGNESSWEYKTILEWIRGGRVEQAKR